MQTGSSETLFGWISGKNSYVRLWDRMEGARLPSQKYLAKAQCELLITVMVKQRRLCIGIPSSSVVLALKGKHFVTKIIRH
jgi:hypothetical protein